MYYRNLDSKPRPLACIDTSEICLYNGLCWSVADTGPLDPAYVFTRLSLRRANVFYSIKYRLGAALLAQEKVSSYKSSELKDDQWEREAEALFKTMLARVQFDALDIATGADKRKDYRLTLPAGWNERTLCDMYKLKVTSAHANIGILIYSFAWMIAFGVWLGARGKPNAVPEKYQDWHPEDMLYFEMLFQWLIRFPGRVWQWLKMVGTWLASRLQRAWKRSRFAFGRNQPIQSNGQPM